jgi:hypothetical protein
MGEKRNSCKVLVGKPAGKRPLWRPGCRWEDNIKTDLRETGRDGVDWIYFGSRWRKVVISCEHGNEPSGSIKAG